MPLVRHSQARNDYKYLGSSEGKNKFRSVFTRQCVPYRGRQGGSISSKY